MTLRALARRIWARQELRIMVVLAPLSIAVGITAALHAVRQGRFGVGVELKPSYYRQAVKNLHPRPARQP